VDTVLRAWQMASNIDIPATQNAIAHIAVKPEYTNHSAFAVSPMRGVNLLSRDGPVVSARNS